MMLTPPLRVRSAGAPLMLCLAQLAFFLVPTAALVPSALAQVAGQSVNMVTGTQWPGGDPFLERQNEPSMAISSRNPLHVVAGSNDYRTVDLPGVPSNKPTGDAWLGLFRSLDGGDTWQSVLVPGYPQDTSSQGRASPLKAYEAGADPMVRAGTNGLFYYSGLAFNRESNGTSAVFVARYIDDNNIQGANTIRYLSTRVVATGDATHFLDKPAIAVDIPRPGSPTCTIPAGSAVSAATIAAGRIYIAYTQFNGPESSGQSAILFSQSSDCGITWSSPQKISGSQQTNQGAAIAIDPSTGNVYTVWRIFAAKGQPNAIAGMALQYGTNKFTQIVQAQIAPFDQATTDVSFRTNAYPSIAVDAAGEVYVAWSARGSGSNSVTGGDARIQVISGKPTYASGNQLKSMQFAGPVTVDPYQGRGHQIMPAMAFSSGKLTVAWYDFRDDDQIAVYTSTGGGHYTFTDEVPVGVTPVFSQYVADPSGPPYPSGVWRHTVDVRAAQANPGFPPSFRRSITLSQYTYGTPAFDPSTEAQLSNNPDHIQQLEFDAPNLPLFQLGTVPFVGDYIDVAGPSFVPSISGNTEVWRFNNLATDPDYSRVVWTDNRNVVQPADGNWANYTPVGSTGSTPSIYNPSQTAPACVVGQTGVRNQDIYTAALSPGIVMGAKGNFKQLSPSLQREFPVTIENPTSQTVYYLLTVQSQPAGGAASFLQFPVAGLPNPMTRIVMGILPLSSASRSVFITSSDPSATVPVNAVQTDVNSNIIPNGLTSKVVLNNDVSNPNISNPNISNVEIYNPNISNPNISNPNISNPNITNPNISNPNISNVAFANPNISNPNISNPNISNPNISNPNISNPNISNTAISGEITDASYTVINAGNTTAAYTLSLLQYQPPPQGVTVQLIVSGVYLTPVAKACTLAVQAHYIPIANIPNPTFVTPGSVLQSGPPPTLAPTFTLQPGEQALITLRVFDPNASTPAQALQDYNPVTSLAPAIGSQGINTGFPAPPPNLTVLSVATSALPPAALNGTYNLALQATGGSGPYTWSVPAGSLPPGIILQEGVLTGTPTVVGTYAVAIQVSDRSGQTAERSFTLIVTPPSVAISTAALPSGQFNTPYSAVLSASGGTPSYTWSVGPGGVLPVGMGLAPSSGTISGAPAQAGIWNVPITVQDSAGLSATANLPMTINPPVGFENTTFPATLLYAPNGVAWSGTALPAGMSLAGGLLTGLPSAGSSSQITATNGNSLPVYIVGASSTNGPVTISNVAVNNGPVQATVTPGSSVTLSMSYNIVNPVHPTAVDQIEIGFSNGLPQACAYSGLPGSAGVSDTATVTLTAPSAPGRYYIGFDRSEDSSCLQTTNQWWNSPPDPTRYIAVIDVIPTTVSYVATVSAVNINGAGYSASLAPSGQFTVALTYSISDSVCPNCIDQIEVGLNSETGPQQCAYNGIDGPNVISDSASITLNAPNAPGRYYIAMDRGQDNGCKATTNLWWNGPRSPAQYIGVIDVQPPSF